MKKRNARVQTVGQRILASLLGGLFATFIYAFVGFVVFGPGSLRGVEEIVVLLILSFFFSLPFYFARLFTLSRIPSLAFIINFLLAIPLLPYIPYLFFGKRFEITGDLLPAALWPYLLMWTLVVAWVIGMLITILLYLYDTGRIEAAWRALSKSVGQSQK